MTGPAKDPALCTHGTCDRPRHVARSGALWGWCIECFRTKRRGERCDHAGAPRARAVTTPIPAVCQPCRLWEGFTGRQRECPDCEQGRAILADNERWRGTEERLRERNRNNSRMRMRQTDPRFQTRDRGSNAWNNGAMFTGKAAALRREGARAAD